MGRALDPRLLLVPLPVWIVGSYDANHRPNMLAVSWAGICCSDPPCVAISLRPETYSYSSIKRQRAFTVNVPSVEYIDSADYCGLVSGAEIDKFNRCALTPLPCEKVPAPYVAEYPVAVACRVIHTIDLGSHTQFVGEIVDVRITETCTDRSGRPSAQKVDPIVLSPASLEYFSLGQQVGRTYTEGQAIADENTGPHV